MFISPVIGDLLFDGYPVLYLTGLIKYKNALVALMSGN